jgi:L-threonylcarbamoyladenylate synthase
MTNSQFFSNCAADSIREAAAALKAGHLVAFPTETVYGLGADARNPDAVRRIYEVKGRPSDHPLIVHISSISQLEKWAIDIPEYAISLARAFWPGPMTLILRRSEIAGDFITGGQQTVGLRVPSDPIALSLIQEFEKISDSAIAAPSANRFGQVSPTSSSDVYDEIGNYLVDSDIVLDGGNSSIGIESTIIDCTGERPRILRPGFITLQDVEANTALHCLSHSNSVVSKFSGSFEKHYAPKCKVVLDKVNEDGAAFLALDTIETPKNMVRIASPVSVEEYAQILYSSLRKADSSGFEVLVVSVPVGDGIALAIRERLKKSAKGR